MYCFINGKRKSFLIEYISELSYFYLSEGVESEHLLLHSICTFTQVRNVNTSATCAPHHPALTKSPVLSQWKPHLSVCLSVRLRAKGSLDCVTHFSADSTKGKFNTGTNMLTDISISEILAGHSSVSPELFHFSFFLSLLVACDENPLSFCVSIAGTNYGDKMSSFSSSVYLTIQS